MSEYSDKKNKEFETSDAAQDDQEQDQALEDGEEQDDEKKKPVLMEKGELGELAKTALMAVAIALIIRTLLFEPFNIPSTSMKPTLLVGDYLFVYKPEYGYSRFSFPFGLAPMQGRVWGAEPERGDVIVFAQPANTYVSFIKRVVGLPGDRIQVRNGRLYINGDIIPREFVTKTVETDETGNEVEMTEYIETLPGGVIHSIYEETDNAPLDNTEEYVVPEEHYFVMGDNRDNSQDSRVKSMVGFVPLENIVGRADFLFFSTNHYAKLFEVWKWPWSIRYNRMFMDIDPIRPEEAEEMTGSKDTPAEDAEGSRG